MTDNSLQRPSAVKQYLEEGYQKKIADLRKKEPSELTDVDRAEIRALRSYFQPHELKAFGIGPDDEAKKQSKAKEE